MGMWAKKNIFFWQPAGWLASCQPASQPTGQHVRVQFSPPAAHFGPHLAHFRLKYSISGPIRPHSSRKIASGGGFSPPAVHFRLDLAHFRLKSAISGSLRLHFSRKIASGGENWTRTCCSVGWLPASWPACQPAGCQKKYFVFAGLGLDDDELILPARGTHPPKFQRGVAPSAEALETALYRTL